MLPELIGLIAVISRPSGTVGIRAVANDENSHRPQVGASSLRHQFQGQGGTDGRPYPPLPPAPNPPIAGR
jgi:hypothetical protein